MLTNLKILHKSALAFSSLTFLLVGLYKLKYFGLEYDETLFINGALGDIDGETFISFKIKNLVIFCYPYIGAIKSWIYMPIFKAFGVSIISVRLPMLLLGSVNLWLSYRVAEKYFNKKIALATLLILSVDLTFLSLQRFDKGPSCIELFFKLLILTWVVKPQKHWLRHGLTILILMLLGTYNKFNFIWFTNALFGVYALQQLPRITPILLKFDFKKLVQTTFFRYCLGYLLFAFLFLSVLKGLIIDGQASTLTLPFLEERLIFCLKETKYLLLQNSIFKVFGWSIAGVPSSTIMNIAILGVIMINFYLYAKGCIRFTSPHTKGLLLLFLIFIQYVITPAATHVWHSFMMYPMVTIIIISSFYQIGQYFGTYIPLITITAIMLGWNIYTTILFNNNINNKECVSEIFIPEINQVLDYIAKDNNRLVISTDWGVHPQLLVLDNKRNKFSEPYRLMMFPTELKKWWTKYELFFHTNKPVVIVQPISTDIAKRTRFGYNSTMEEKKTEDFIHYLEQKGVKIWPTKLIKNPCGDRLFQIYEARVPKDK
ncbi:glycosyltransferase family 39 protein [Flectobacillus roseus]